MRGFYLAVLSLCIILVIAGCSMPYVMKVDRVDQKMEEGNRGYLKGTPPPAKDREDLKRPFIAVDIDLPEVETRDRKEKVEAEVEVKGTTKAREENIK